MKQTSTSGRLLGGILLVSGTAIGAGMLALPVSTGLAGFVPSVILILSCWFYLTFTAFLMLEVNLWMEEGNTNLISMARRTLGTCGEVVSWIAYLFLLYALTTAYIAGSGSITVAIIYSFTGYNIPSYLGSFPLLLLFGFFVYKGTSAVDYVNRMLMLGLILTYGCLVIFLAPHVDLSLLQHADWRPLWVATSVIVTSFGFHIIIPTLTTYLDRDIPKLRLSILIGSIIPLVVYLIWEFLVLGIIPVEGEQGLQQGFEQGIDGAQLLSLKLGHSAIGVVDRFFSFFAIVTSFLGVSLSLSDFLADGLKIKKTRLGRILLYLLTFAPPLMIAVTNPRVFLSALEYAGAFGVIVLLGIMPALMVWRGRYHYRFKSTFKAPGGKLALILVVALGLLVIGWKL